MRSPRNHSPIGRPVGMQTDGARGGDEYLVLGCRCHSTGGVLVECRWDVREQRTQRRSPFLCVYVMWIHSGYVDEDALWTRGSGCMYVCTIMYGVCLCDCEYECDCERVHVCIASYVRARNCTRGGNGVRGEGGAVKWREVRGGEKRSFCQSGIRILVFSSVFLTRSFVLCLCDISYARAYTHVPCRPNRAHI